MELDDELKRIIRAFGLEVADYPLVIPAAYFGKGRVGLFRDVLDFSQWIRNNLTTGWYFNEMWSDGFREIWWNTEKRAIFTYCEGDIDLTVDEDQETFDKRWKAAEGFYGKY